MTPDANEVTTTTAVTLGVVVLVAAPVTIIVSSVIVTGLETVGGSPVSEWTGIAVLGVSFVVGLQFAAEAAAIQLHGLSALRRDRPGTTIVRHLLVAAGAVVAVGLATWYVLRLVVGESTWYIAVLAALVALATLISFSRSSSAAVAGFLSDSSWKRNRNSS